MHTLNIEEAKNLIHAINDASNPTASLEALNKRDKWILENDLGILQMSADVRKLLESTIPQI